MTKEEFIDAIKAMSVAELNELVEALQEEFGVSGAPMMMAGPMMGGGAAAGDAGEEEKSTYDIMLTAPGDKKIQVIKAVKEITGLGLKEAKALVDSAPDAKIKEGVAPDEAEAIKKQLEEAGGTVELK